MILAKALHVAAYALGVWAGICLLAAVAGFVIGRALRDPDVLTTRHVDAAFRRSYPQSDIVPMREAA